MNLTNREEIILSSLNTYGVADYEDYKFLKEDLEEKLIADIIKELIQEEIHDLLDKLADERKSKRPYTDKQYGQAFNLGYDLDNWKEYDNYFGRYCRKE